MGYGLSVFMISPKDVDILGSRKFDLCETVIDQHGARFDEYDKMLDEDDVDQLSHRAALKEIFSGNITQPHYGGVYGWSFEIYCSFIGNRLNETPFSPCELEFYEQVDRVLESNSVPLRLDYLISDCPIELPNPDDWPCVGHWPSKVIENAMATFNQISFSIDDPDVQLAVNTIRGWCQHWECSRDSMLVGFHG